MLYPDDRTQEHPALLSDLVYVHIIPYLHMSDIAFMQKARTMMNGKIHLLLSCVAEERHSSGHALEKRIRQASAIFGVQPGLGNCHSHDKPSRTRG